ncbi:MAG: Rpn family recombination-promoting nuclease/putative transposase [Oscillospiraceae bacterium]|nr:Rpn family recombination-promoting nuclease/putative transposase [Oscillospiraceae bacterium]
MAKLKNTFKTDILFKMLFRKHQNLLKQLVAHLLSIPLKSISNFILENPEMPPESIGKKFCRLDIHMTVNDQKVNLEVQVENEGNFPERALFYWARIYSSTLPEGNNYIKLPRTIVISIINFPLFPQYPEFHSEFQALEVTRHNPLTDKMVLHFFELLKLPKDIGSNDMLLLWLALFKADTEEELKRLSELGVTELSEAVNAYHSVTASAEFKEMERLRIKASHDEAQAVGNAERRGEKRGVKRANAKWKGIVSKKDAALSEKDAALSERDAIIAELRKQMDSRQ